MVDEVQLGDVPFQEAIDHFQGKLNLPTPYWDALVGEAHAKAFTVAGATKLDLLTDIRNLVNDAIENGTTLADFRNGFDAAVEKHGWSFKGDPKWRAAVIYDTNIRTAYAAGKWKQIERTKDSRPYLQYLTVGDSRVRPEHQRWDEMVLMVNDPWWDTHYPPNGWGCRCTVRTLSQSQIESEGFSVSKPPPLDLTERINAKTGEVYGNVPKGIDVGWNYNVGKEWLRWDHVGRLPDCDGPFDFSDSDGKTCIKPLPGQKTWKDYGRLDLRKVPIKHRVVMPEMLPEASSIDEAVATLKNAIGMTASVKTITTAVNETVVINEKDLTHMVEKRENARERYANFVLPTLTSPYEVYLTEYEDGWRTRYIGIFEGKNGLLVVVRRNQDGSVLYNIMNSTNRKMNRHRVGELIYKVGE